MTAIPPWRRPEAREVISDYAGFPFESQWARRAAVTQVERRIVSETLAESDRRRVLELGVGFGRLSTAVATGSTEYVAADLDPSMLNIARSRPPPSARLYVEANLFHLPFVAGTFSAEVMIRVYHHVASPTEVAREIHRTLVSGGTAVVSYNPKHTVGTLVQEVRERLRGPDVRGSLSAVRTTPAVRGPFPIFVPTVEEFSATWSGLGFVIEEEWASGLEHFSRWLPEDVWLRLGHRFPSCYLLPQRFARLRQPRGDAPPNVLPPLEDSIACPRCRRPSGRVELTGEWTRECPACGFTIAYHGGILRARYLPESAIVYGPRSAVTATSPAAQSL